MNQDEVLTRTPRVMRNLERDGKTASGIKEGYQG